MREELSEIISGLEVDDNENIHLIVYIGGKSRAEGNNKKMGEVNAVNIENIVRARLGDKKRTSYTCAVIPKKLLTDTHKDKK
ncbi:MAG: hypothetical protein CMO01_17450 [Thalassobius sp.]|nr:hypothetical protein [Thalassovita sp.]